MEEATATTPGDARAPAPGAISAPSNGAHAAGERSDVRANASVVYELQRSPALQQQQPQQQLQQEEEAVASQELQPRDDPPATADPDAPQQPTHSRAVADDVVVDPPANDSTATSDRATEQASAPPSTATTELQRLHAAAAAVVAPTDAQRKRLDDELQCILCHDVLFKPVTATCGHSFCRVCLLDSCLSRAIAEAQCPVCRADVMRHFADSPTSIAFNVNVTLWNVIQLLVPASEYRESQQEDDEYAHKLDQLTAKWRIHALQTSADRFHRSSAAGVDDDGDSDSVGDGENDDEWRLDGHGDRWDNDDSDDGLESESGDANGRSLTTEDARRRHRRRRRRQRALRRERVRLQNRYPQLKVEHTVDGRLRVARNVVLDTDDANDDGLQTMRVSLALVEFPSIVERYSEHQECSLAILKMEEDEEIDSGFPFFMSESGDDDALVVSTFYNHVTLKVFDDGGNNVLERTRAARQGIVDFPELRLDVPAGDYTFHFSDDLYGMYLTVKTTLSELTDVSDAPLQDRGYRSYVADEATDTSRQRGRRREREWTASDEEDAMLADDDDAGHDSDNSFIVNDDDDDGDAHGVTAAFSGDEGGNGGGEREDEDEAWSVHSDDEDADEAAAAQHIARRNRHRSRRPGVWDDDDDGDGGASAGTELRVHDMTGSDDSGSDAGPGARRRHRHVVELVSQETDAPDHTVDDDVDDMDAPTRRRQTGSRRVVLDSDGDDDDDVNAGEVRAPLLADGDVARERTPPQYLDCEEVQRPQSKRRARTVVLSEDDDDDEEDEFDDDDDDDEAGASRFTPHKRQKMSARIDGGEDDDDASDSYAGDGDGDSAAALLGPPHPWFDDRRESDDDDQEHDEAHRLHPYHDERVSDDDDGWQQEQDHQFEEDHYGEADYGDDDHGDDGGGGWY